MKQLSILSGSLTYEFRMQARRRALRITMILLAILLVFFLTRHTGLNDILNPLNNSSLPAAVAYWTDMVNFALLPIGVGILLADRLPRDARHRIDELFTSMPGSLLTRLFGKYLGSTLATLLPLFAFYCLGIGYLLWQRHTLLVIPLACAAFATIILPGILFVAAFSLACPAIMWVPLYQFLYVGYWFWGNLFPPGYGVPTLSATLLTPMGGNMSLGFFGVRYFFAGQHITALQSIASILLLVGIALCVIVVLSRFLTWRQARQ